MITKDDLKRLCLENIELLGFDNGIKRGLDFEGAMIESLSELHESDDVSEEIVTLSILTFIILAVGGYSRYSESAVTRKIEEYEKFNKSAISVVAFILSTWDAKFKGLESCLPFFLNDMIALIEFKGYDSKKVMSGIVGWYKSEGDFEGREELMRLIVNCKKRKF